MDKAKALDQMNKERVAIELRAKDELGQLARQMIKAGFDPAMIVPQEVANKMMARMSEEQMKKSIGMYNVENPRPPYKPSAVGPCRKSRLLLLVAP